MKTNQVMETIDRELMGQIIKQRTKDTFMCLDDVLGVCNLYLFKSGKKKTGFDFYRYIQSENVKDFLGELEKEIGTNPYIKGAKNRVGWVHPFFALKILIHCNPKFEVQVYKWLWDYLIQNRVDSGDSYTKMCGVVYKYSNRKDMFSKNIKWLAGRIKERIGCEDWNQATQEQLKERDYLQNLISDLCQTFKDSKQGIKIAFMAYEERKQSGQLQ